MNPDYESYLVCDHKDITVYYVRGLEAAIYHKKGSRMEIVNPARMKKFVDMISNMALPNLAAINQPEPK